jgi:ribonuclease BN (tRNA processing enzyme)
MEIKVLGAHNCESATSKLTSLLIDETVALDVGALTSSLTLEEQELVSIILLTHCHYDHIRDLAAVALNVSHFEKNIRVYSQAGTLNAVSEHVLNGIIYPDFTRIPASNPPLVFLPLVPLEVTDIDGYKVLPVPVKHGVTTVGYEINSGEGKSFFYSGDTGPELADCWERISPQFLFIDVTLPNRLEKHAISSSHLTPGLLGKELAVFRKMKGYLPEVLPIHLSPMFEDEIRAELERVSQELDVNITPASEGMTLSL